MLRRRTPPGTLQLLFVCKIVQIPRRIKLSFSGKGHFHSLMDYVMHKIAWYERALAEGFEGVVAKYVGGTLDCFSAKMQLNCI